MVLLWYDVRTGQGTSEASGSPSRAHPLPA